MPVPVTFLLLLILFSVSLITVLFVHPGVTVTRSGKIMAFLVLFFLPLLCAWMEVSSELERSKSTAFCLSCHIMEPYGKSLRVDDSSYLAAAHFQNHRVPAGEACYICHTNYTMFGTAASKLRGCVTSTSITSLLLRRLKKSSCTTLTTTANACIATRARGLLNRGPCTTPIRIFFPR